MNDLHATVDELADNLVTPIVPGEVEAWLVAVRESADRTNAILRKHVNSVHSSKYAQIVQADPELFRRVEQMKAKDHECLEELAALIAQVKNIQAKAGKAEPNEAILQETLDAFVEQSLGFINHVRMQEKATEVWLSEAYNRDRGVAD